MVCPFKDFAINAFNNDFSREAETGDLPAFTIATSGGLAITNLDTPGSPHP